GKEQQRIETPPGGRASTDYALLMPDWKTLYVPDNGETFKRIERDGKKGWRRDYDGKIRVWDIGSGKEMDPISIAENTSPLAVVLSPDGRHLVYVEQPGYDSFNLDKVKFTTIVLDLMTNKKWNLCDGFA